MNATVVVAENLLGYNMINLTEPAVTKIKDILAEESDPNLKLRIFVQGGGCSGFSHGFTLETEVNEDDFQVTNYGFTLLIDSISAQYLTGAKVDYKETLMGSNFAIDVPNSTGSCGCGSSFSM
jgi:iron-sulfur cluster insertion protein